MGVKTIDLNANFFSFFCTFSDSYFTYLWPSRRAKFIHRMREMERFRHLLCELMTAITQRSKKNDPVGVGLNVTAVHIKKRISGLKQKKEAILLLLVERISFIVLPKTLNIQLNHELLFAVSYQKYYLKISADCTAFIQPLSAHEPYRRKKSITSQHKSIEISSCFVKIN